MIFGDMKSSHMMWTECSREHVENHVPMIICYINHIAAIVVRLRKSRQLRQVLLQ